MELNGITYQLIASYLAGECSPGEGERVERWIDESQEHKKQFQEIRRLWKLSGKAVSLSSSEEKNIEEEWSQLSKQIRGPRDLSSKNDSDGKQYEGFRSDSIHSGTQKFIRIAAIFLIAAMVGWFSYQNWYQQEQKEQETVLRQISTDKGQRANLTLGDGTEVMLNAESELQLPEEFTSDVREVHLDGEAYFKVSTNVDKPFLVYSRQSVVRVLGTSFSVRSYPEDQQVQVVVEEGRVSFGDQTDTDDRKVILNKNELGTYDTSSSMVTAKSVDDIELYMSWRDGYLKFEETMLKDVAKALERRYDVEVLFEDADLKQRLLTAYLKSRSLRNVLDVITASLEIQYQLEDNKITFLN